MQRRFPSSRAALPTFTILATKLRRTLEIREPIARSQMCSIAKLTETIELLNENPLGPVGFLYKAGARR
jgi:hypothetical protein